MTDTGKYRLLALMAHPDDAEILVGGTLLHLKDLGWQLGLATMTSGDCGSATHSKAEIMRTRSAEAQAAADFLEAWYGCAGLMDAEVFANTENLRKVVEILRSFDPHVVVTHSPVDYMLDHEETSRLVRGATFVAAVPLYKSRSESPALAARSTPALYYADPIEGKGPLGDRIYPQFYVDISRHLSGKRDLLAHHKSQREWLRRHHAMDEYLERMTAWAALYGSECGCAYAEGFRQHLGHAYPQEPILQKALHACVVTRTPKA